MKTLEALKRELFILTMKDRWDARDYREARRIRREIKEAIEKRS